MFLLVVVLAYFSAFFLCCFFFIVFLVVLLCRPFPLFFLLLSLFWLLFRRVCEQTQQNCRLPPRATDVHRANKNYIYIIIIGVLSIHQLSSVQFRYSSKDFQSFEVLLEGGRFPLPCRGDNLWWLPLQGTRSEEIMDVDLQ